jgi:alpha-beta hydrolase superfamily lysophospholipase
MPPYVRWVVRLTGLGALVFVTVLIGRGVQARNLPDLELWHHIALREEVTAADLGPDVSLDDYRRREQRLFEELEARVERAVPADRRTVFNRYFPDSRASPRRFPTDGNRTFELAPPTPVGGVLLLHGLTDSPYSMRRLAHTFESRGFYALALRMPGHGTIPSGLVSAGWEDWAAAVRLGVRHVRARIGASAPLLLAGYSNGGALVVHYALAALEDNSLPRPDGLLLLSPMLGVTPFARLSWMMSLLAPIPYFEKSAWLDVLPEYNPFKYNSFPVNAGKQTYELTTTVARQFARLRSTSKLAAFPEVLAFQSLVDATVSTPAVVDGLFAHVQRLTSELVLFDINRVAGLTPFLRPADETIVASLFAGRKRTYRVSLVTNAAPDTLVVVEQSLAAGETTVTQRPLGAAWPEDVFSLSHVAVPFPPDDPLYGRDSGEASSHIRIGRFSARGERAVLMVPMDVLMRLSHNPFFEYMERRIGEWIDRQGRHPMSPPP